MLMTLVNETGQEVFYFIASQSNSECGHIDVDGVLDRPDWDSQSNVTVGFSPVGGTKRFEIICDNTGTGQQVEMALIVEGGE
jgi:hypothetical protein